MPCTRTSLPRFLNFLKTKILVMRADTVLSKSNCLLIFVAIFLLHYSGSSQVQIEIRPIIETTQVEYIMPTEADTLLDPFDV